MFWWGKVGESCEVWGFLFAAGWVLVLGHGWFWWIGGWLVCWRWDDGYGGVVEGVGGCWVVVGDSGVGVVLVGCVCGGFGSVLQRRVSSLRGSVVGWFWVGMYVGEVEGDVESVVGVVGRVCVWHRYSWDWLG